MERIAIMHPAGVVKGPDLEALLPHAAPPRPDSDEEGDASPEGIAQQWRSRVKGEEKVLLEKKIQEADTAAAAAVERREQHVGGVIR
jgi:hypothetical protein